MHAFQKYLLYKGLIKQLRNKAVATKIIESHVDGHASQIEWHYAKYAVKSYSSNSNYSACVTTPNGEHITTFIGARAKELHMAAYWLAIEQAPANALRNMIKIDRTAIDFAFDEISSASLKSR